MVSVLTPVAAASAEKTVLGLESGVFVVVTQAAALPVVALVQPDGSAGAVTVSKSCERFVSVFRKRNC